MRVNSARELGALVRSERKKHGWSQKDLASRAGVSDVWVSQVERGKPTAHFGLILRTLKTLDVPLWAGEPPKVEAGAGARQIDLDELVKP